MGQISEEAADNIRSISIKMDLVGLIFEVQDLMKSEKFLDALKLVGAFSPRMNSYMDQIKGREVIVLKKWTELCEFVGIGPTIHA